MSRKAERYAKTAIDFGAPAQIRKPEEDYASMTLPEDQPSIWSKIWGVGMKGLEYLGRPTQAIEGLGVGLAESGSGRGGVLGLFENLFSPKAWGGALKTGYNALTGEDYITTQRMFRMKEGEDLGAAKWAAGAALDIFADPLWFVSAGAKGARFGGKALTSLGKATTKTAVEAAEASTKLGKLYPWMSKTAVRAGKVLETEKAAAGALKEAATKGEKVFFEPGIYLQTGPIKGQIKIPYSELIPEKAAATWAKLKEVVPGLQEGTDLWYKTFGHAPRTEVEAIAKLHEKELAWQKNIMAEYGKKIHGTIEEAAKTAGKTYDEIADEVIKIAESKTGDYARVLKKAPEHIQKIVKDLEETEKIWKDLEGVVSKKDLLEADVLEQTNRFMAGKKGALNQLQNIDAKTKDLIEYLPHIITPEGKEFFAKKYLGGKIRQWTDTHTSMLERQFGEMTIPEVEKVMKEAGYAGKEFFYHDPAIATATRGLKSAKVLQTKQFLKEAAAYGVKASDAAADWVEVKAAEIDDALKGLKFDPKDAKVIDRMYEFSTNPDSFEAVNKFIKGFDTVQDLWKSYTLGAAPANHTRNVVTNVWSSFLNNAKPAAFVDTLQFLRGKAGKKLEAQMMVGQRLGIFGVGEHLSEMRPEQIADVISGKWSLNPLSRNFYITKGGKRLGSAVDDFFRRANYVSLLREGYSSEEAAKEIKKLFFDYGELTDVEKKIFRRIMPFYSWSRNNIPLQFRMLIEKPAKMALVEKVRKSLIEKGEREGSVDERFLASWLKEGMGVPIKQNEDGSWSYGLLGGWLPVGDLQRMTKGMDMAAEAVSPLIRTPIEIGANRSAFTGRQIEEYPGEKTDFFGMRVSKKWIDYPAQQIRPIQTVRRMVPTQQESESGTVTPMGAVLRQITGMRTYDFTPEKQREYYIKRVKSRYRNLDILARMAIKNGDFAKAAEVQEEINKMRGAIEQE